GLEKFEAVGKLKEHGATWLLALLRRCVSAGWVSFAGVDRPVVTLTEDGRAVMKGEHPARLLLPAVASRSQRGAETVARPRPTTAVEPAPAHPRRDPA